MARNERKYYVSNPFKIRKTRVPELGYTHFAGDWRYVDLQDGRQALVGAYYATEKELLSDFIRYATEWGYVV